MDFISCGCSNTILFGYSIKSLGLKFIGRSVYFKIKPHNLGGFIFQTINKHALLIRKLGIFDGKY